MNTRTTLAIAAASLALGIGSTLAVVAMQPAPEPAQITPACATEDATGCYWDATTQGNGEGVSFYTDTEGHTYYIPDTTDVDAYGAAVKALRDASGQGEDLLPHLIHLAEVDNSIRLAR